MNTRMIVINSSSKNISGITSLQEKSFLSYGLTTTEIMADKITYPFFNEQQQQHMSHVACM